MINKFLFSVIISIFLISLYYLKYDIEKFSGKIRYKDGSKNFTHIETYRGNRFKLTSYIETKNNVININCKGKYKRINGNIDVIFDTSQIEDSCLGEYKLNKISDQCYILQSSVIKSNNQTFFFCKKI